ncbi:hypothetical protein GGI12_000919 [Dipsacomyces acuminosporus]|nr:hypothetical protein GGI12_000919 [Dipsacomyces acuminosporus]
MKPEEASAIEDFLAAAENVGQKNGPTNEKIVHDLAAGLGLKNAASMLYKNSPDAKAAYSAVYDTLLFLSVSGFSDQSEKDQLSKVTKYFESHLI